MHNESRGKHGRFLLGHRNVDSMAGGVFVLDVSSAQPGGGVEFLLEQLAAVLDYWVTSCPNEKAPWINIMAVAGDAQVRLGCCDGGRLQQVRLGCCGGGRL